MKIFCVASLFSLLMSIGTLSASESSYEAAFEKFKQSLLARSSAGFYRTHFRGLEVVIDVNAMQYKCPLINPSTREITVGRCLISIVHVKDSCLSNFYTDAYYDGKTSSFIEHNHHLRY